MADFWKKEVTGNPMRVLFSKLKFLKPLLKDFNKQHFGNISNKVRDVRNRLVEAQGRVLYSPMDDDILLVKKLTAELQGLLAADEAFYRKKSRV